MKQPYPFLSYLSSSNTQTYHLLYVFLSISDSDFDKISKTMEDERETFLSKSTQISGYLDNEGAELKGFTSCLKWVCLDQSNFWRTSLSWSIFFLLTIGVPLVSQFALSCSSCDQNHSRPYRVVVQVSLSVFAMLSFVCLSRWSRKYGLRRFLFLDKLCEVSEKVQHGYTEQLQVKLYSCFLFFQIYSIKSLIVHA